MVKWLKRVTDKSLARVQWQGKHIIAKSQKYKKGIFWNFDLKTNKQTNISETKTLKHLTGKAQYL